MSSRHRTKKNMNLQRQRAGTGLRQSYNNERRRWTPALTPI